MEALAEFEKKYSHINRTEGDKINRDPLFRALRLETEALEDKCK